MSVVVDAFSDEGAFHPIRMSLSNVIASNAQCTGFNGAAVAPLTVGFASSNATGSKFAVANCVFNASNGKHFKTPVTVAFVNLRSDALMYITSNEFINQNVAAYQFVATPEVADFSNFVFGNNVISCGTDADLDAKIQTSIDKDVDSFTSALAANPNYPNPNGGTTTFPALITWPGNQKSVQYCFKCAGRIFVFCTFRIPQKGRPFSSSLVCPADIHM